MTAKRLPETAVIDIRVGLPARDQAHLQIEVSSTGEIISAALKVVGCPEMLKLAEAWRPRLKGPLAQLAIPQGIDHSSILLREVLLKAQGKWQFPYGEEELCHCRAVPTAKVDAAIIGGCHTVDAVKSATSASTSCGTCRPDVEKILAYRLAKS